MEDIQIDHKRRRGHCLRCSDKVCPGLADMSVGQQALDLVGFIFRAEPFDQLYLAAVA